MGAPRFVHQFFAGFSYSQPHGHASAVGRMPIRARADAAAVPGGVAPGRGERPRPLHAQVQVVLDRVADGAVALERLGGRRTRAASDAMALAIDTSRAAGVGAGAPASRRPGRRRAANASSSGASARWCLTAWKRADRHAELLALLDVVDGQVEHALGRGRRAARRRRARPGRTQRPPRRVVARPGVVVRRLPRRRCAARRDPSTVVDRRGVDVGRRVDEVQRVRRAVAAAAQSAIGRARRRTGPPVGRAPMPSLAAVARPASQARRIAGRRGQQRRGDRRRSRRTGRAARPGPSPPAAAPGRARSARARRRPRARATPSTPISASAVPHAADRAPRRPAPSRPTAARTTAGGHSFVEQVAHGVAERELVVGEREAHAAATSSAGRGRARRRRCAGSRWCRRRSDPTARTASPSSTGPSTLGLGAEQVERRLVQLDVELGPAELHQARLGARRPALDDAGDRLRASAAGTPRRRIHASRPAGRASDRIARSVTRSRVQRSTSRSARPGTGRASAGSGRAPSRSWPWRPTSPTPSPSTTPPSTASSGTNASSKNTSAKPSSPSRRPKPRTVTPVGVERDEEVGEAAVALGVGVGAEQAEQVGAERAAGGPGLLPVEHASRRRLVVAAAA